MSAFIFDNSVTGRKVCRLTDGGLNISPYFNSWAWSPDGDSVCFLKTRGREVVVLWCEVATRKTRQLAGPYRLSPPHSPFVDAYLTLNAIPRRRGVTFVAEDRVWGVDGGIVSRRTSLKAATKSAGAKLTGSCSNS